MIQLKITVTAEKPIDYHLLGYRLLSLSELFYLDELLIAGYLDKKVQLDLKQWAIENDIFYRLFNPKWNLYGNVAHKVMYDRLLSTASFLLSFDTKSRLYKFAKKNNYPILLVQKNIRITKEQVLQII